MTTDPAAMIVLRALHLAAMLSLLGTAGFLAWMLPVAGEVPAQLQGRLVWFARCSGVAALVAGAGWFVLQADAIAGAATFAELRDALPVVALHTRFGHVLLARMGLLILATGLASGRLWRLHMSLILAAVAAAIEGLIGHAGATVGQTGDELVLSEALHLTAAGLWLGALVPLLLAVAALPTARAAAVCERFSPLGLGCVLILAGTGAAQAFDLVGSLPGLVGTPYGQIALLKIVLFLCALVLAGINRLWLTDRVGQGASTRPLRLSILGETLLGLCIIAAAAALASTQPAAHTQPVWPFRWQISLATVHEDPQARRPCLDVPRRTHPPGMRFRAWPGRCRLESVSWLIPTGGYARLTGQAIRLAGIQRKNCWS